MLLPLLLLLFSRQRYKICRLLFAFFMPLILLLFHDTLLRGKSERARYLLFALRCRHATCFTIVFIFDAVAAPPCHAAMLLLYGGDADPNHVERLRARY